MLDPRQRREPARLPDDERARITPGMPSILAGHRRTAMVPGKATDVFEPHPRQCRFRLRLRLRLGPVENQEAKEETISLRRLYPPEKYS